MVRNWNTVPLKRVRRPYAENRGIATGCNSIDWIFDISRYPKSSHIFNIKRDQFRALNYWYTPEKNHQAVAFREEYLSKEIQCYHLKMVYHCTQKPCTVECEINFVSITFLKIMLAVEKQVTLLFIYPETEDLPLST